MHLDRDDLGERNDAIEVAGRRVLNPLNQEIVSIRGILPGEYVVNLHLYRGDRRPAGAGDGQDREAQSQGRARVLRAAHPHRTGRRADRGALLARRRRPGARSQSIAEAAGAAPSPRQRGRRSLRHDRGRGRPRGKLSGDPAPAAQPQPQERLALAGEGGRDPGHDRLPGRRFPRPRGDARLAHRGDAARPLPAPCCSGTRARSDKSLERRDLPLAVAAGCRGPAGRAAARLCPALFARAARAGRPRPRSAAGGQPGRG